MCYGIAEILTAAGVSAGTASAISTGVTVATTAASIAASAYGAVSSAQSQKEASDKNAALQREQAKQTMGAGAEAAAAKREKARKIGATQTAQMAAGGLDITSGTPLQLLTETAGMGELDALKTINNASRQAWGYGVQADIDEESGKTAMKQGYLGAGTSILGGVSKGYYGAKQAGMFD